MAENKNPASTQDALQQYRKAAVDRLESKGLVETGCGSFDTANHSISFAADPGCETFNDDFIAVWIPKQVGAIGWAAAIADGVTGSLLAQEAAELACCLGLSAISKGNFGQSKISQNPVAYVTRLFHRIGRRARNQPDEFQPPDCPNSIWKIAIREGKFLQTTLTLIWLTPEGLRVMAVGDGGLIYSCDSDPGTLATHTFGSGVLECLGPCSYSTQTEAYLLEDWSGIVGYTDGLAEPIEQLPELRPMLFDRNRTIRGVIDYLNCDYPELVNDNLSAFRVVKV